VISLFLAFCSTSSLSNNLELSKEGLSSTTNYFRLIFSLITAVNLLSSKLLIMTGSYSPTLTSTTFPSFLLKAFVLLLFFDPSDFLTDYFLAMSWVEPVVYPMVLNLLPVLRILYHGTVTFSDPSRFFISVLWACPFFLQLIALCPCSCSNSPFLFCLNSHLPWNFNSLVTGLHGSSKFKNI